MKLSRAQLETKMISDLVMKCFLRADVKAYFAALYEMTGKKRYRDAFAEVEPYTHVEPDVLIYDESCIEDPLQGITVGKLLMVASNLLEHRTALFSEHNVSQEQMNQQGSALIKLLLIQPCADLYAIRNNEKKHGGKNT